MINKCKGDLMFKSVWTWNLMYASNCPIKCKYCYMTRVDRPYKALTFRKEFLKDDLGAGRTIFINSSYESFLPSIKMEWWESIIDRCKDFPDNKYLVITKKPDVMSEMINDGLKFPSTFVLGLTLETNRFYKNMYSPACPSPEDRVKAFAQLPGKRMVVVDPAMDFDHKEFVDMIRYIGPDIVAYGTETNSNYTERPSRDKSAEFLREVGQFSKIYVFKRYQKVLFAGDRNLDIKKMKNYRVHV
jgi:DNA repair photolyase